METQLQGIYGGMLDGPDKVHLLRQAWGLPEGLAVSGSNGRPHTKSFSAGFTTVYAGPRGYMAQDEANGLVCAVQGAIRTGPDAMLRDAGCVETACNLNPAQIILRLHAGPDFAAALAHLRGSFVFAIQNIEQRTLTLGRDRFGGCILYYAPLSCGFLYASRLAPLARAPWVSRRIDPQGLTRYFADGYIAAPHTIYSDLRLLPPGHLLEYGERGTRLTAFAPLEPEGWPEYDGNGMDEKALVDRMEYLLGEAIRQRLPDTPRAAVYLSGGHDTSLLSGIIQRHTDREVVAYTLGFKDSPVDESEYARAVARHQGLDHHELYWMERESFLEAFEQLPEIFGQPFSDISAIPTSIIAAKVSSHFDEVYCGDGPDFMLGNFDYRLLWHYYRVVPPRLRQACSQLTEAVQQAFFRRWLSPNLSVPEMLRQPDFSWIYHKKFKAEALGKLLNRTVRMDEFPVHDFLNRRTDIPACDRLLLAEHMFYGMDDVLCKATSCHDLHGVSLFRPYYDRELVEFCWGLPSHFKFRKGRGRYLQRQLLTRYMPDHLIDRPKRGFIVDFVQYGEKNFRILTDRYLTRRRLAESGFLNPDYALQCVEEYFGGNRRMGPKVWTLLMFEAWREAFAA